MSDLLNAALSYAKRGWHVFPLHWPVDGKCSCGKYDCDSPAKHPLTKNGFKDATRDPETIREWWQRWPLANIGIATGAVSGIVVIDIDSPEAKETFKQTLSPDYDFNSIPRSRTGRGWHLVYAYPGTQVKSRSNVLPKIDCRADGGYFVAEPSTHISGKKYHWQVSLSEKLPKLPVELYKLLSGSNNNDAGNHEQRRRFDSSVVWEGLEEGQRDDELFRYACQLRSYNAPRDVAEELMLKAASRCKPPFPERIALEKVESAYKKFEPRGRKEKATEPKTERRPITVRVSDVEREEVSWLWKDRIPRGKLTIFEGDPGEGKSFLSQAIATAITRGFGLPSEEDQTQPETVLIMSAEDGLADTIRPRLEDMGADISKVVALRGLIDEEGQERPLSLADLDVIEKAIVEHQPALVIIDPIIAYVAGKDTHKANEVRSLLAPLAALAEKHKTAILAIRHLNKGTSKASYRGQGSIDFLAACRSAFLAGEDPENPGRKVFCHIKSNLGPITPSLTYTINEGCFLWGEETSLTADQVLAERIEAEERSKLDEAKEFLQDILANEPVDSSEVEKERKRAGIAPATLKRAKTALGVKARKASFGGGWLWDFPNRRSSSKPEDAHANKMSAFGNDEHLRDKEAGWEDVS